MNGTQAMTTRRHDLAAIAFATLVVFATTQGPVISLWMRSTTPWDAPNVSTAITATFLAIGAVATGLLCREQHAWTRLDSVRTRLVVAFVAVVSLSTLWSTSRSTTFTSAAGIASMVVCAAWLQLRLTTRQQVAAVFVAMQLGLAASVFALWRVWPGSKDIDKYWAGIYYNPNSLAPVAAFSIMSGTYLAWWAISGLIRSERTPLTAVPLVLFVALSHVVAYRMLSNADSATWTLVLGVVAVVVAVVWALKWRGLQGHHIAGVFIGAGLGLAAISRSLSTSLSEWTGRGEDVSGRTTIWQIAFDGWKERPVAGWGFNAAWLDPTFRVPLQVDPTLAATIYSAHNGFLEVLLGTGPVGLLLLAGAMLPMLFVLGTQFCADRRASSWPLAVITATFIANLAETFIAPNHFLWLLLAAAILTPQDGPGRPAHELPAGVDDPEVAATQ